MRATARLTTGGQPLLMIIVDPACSDPAWPEDGLSEELEVASLGERWDGELFEVTASDAPRPELLWRGQEHGVLLMPEVGTATDVADALTVEERSDGVVVQADAGLIDDAGWDVVGLTIGEEADGGDTDGSPAPARLAVIVVERTDDAVAEARAADGGEELDGTSVDGGELYEHDDGRFRLVGETAIVRSEFAWDPDPGDQRDRMREILTTIRADREPADG